MEQITNNATKETLYLFTNEYPYGTGESFIENELEKHLLFFKEIKIIPLLKKGIARPVHEKIMVLNLFENESYQPLPQLMKNAFSYTALLLQEFFSVTSKVAFLKQFSTLKSSLLQNFYRAACLEKQLNKEKNRDAIIFYSFWTDDWATVLSILKRKNKISHFISRVHGYDLYKERWTDQLIPFRTLQLKNVGKIMAASKDGLQYLETNYPTYKPKFSLSHLSINDNGISPFDATGIFTMVSCSNLIPLKRVHLIAAALAEIKFPIKWIHFGDGVEKQKLLTIIEQLPKHIVVDLKGFVSNEVLVDFYKKNSVNVFLHLSETEGGVPLALQEAASFGIPLIGAMAGGSAEIITNETGIPLSISTTATILATAITTLKNSDKNTMTFRKNVRTFWQQTFGSETNYKILYQTITS
jgi:glycosyltransferase involved in cell wall biosynthesis